MKIEASDLAQRLAGWRHGDGRLHDQLHRALVRLLEHGGLRPGVRLPGERSLAEVLGISRATVAQAYSTLREAGIISARHGSAPRITPGQPETPLGRSLGQRVTDIYSVVAQEGHIDLSTASPPAAPPVIDLLTDPLSHGVELHDLVGGSGYALNGHDRLLDALTRHLARLGLSSTPEELAVTNGAHQALSLVASALVTTDRPPAIEEVTYPGAIDVLMRHSRRGVVALPLGYDGLDGTRAARVIRSVRPSIAYLTTFQNPTGTLRTPAAAEAVVQAGVESRTVIVEDRTLADLAVGGATAPPLAALAPAGSVVTMGSMSKVYWAGLRVGWLHATPPLADYFRTVRARRDLGGAPPLQAIAAVLLDQHHDQVVRWRQELIRKNVGVIRSGLANSDLSWTFRPPDGGLSLWIDTHRAARDAVEQAAAQGVSVLAGPSCSLTEDVAGSHIRLSISRRTEDVLAAVQRLTQPIL